MSVQVIKPEMMNAAPPHSRLSAVLGIAGAVMALTVLATSATLRLGSELVSGGAVSTLTPTFEVMLRGLHRIAAMGISVLVLFLFWRAWRTGRTGSARRPFAIAAGLLAVTVVLSVLGPLTPGYRHDWVTVGNVGGGVALVMLFVAWALIAFGAERSVQLPIGRTTLSIFVAQVLLGAWVSAQAMSGKFDLLLPHILLGAVLVVSMGAWAMRVPGAGATNRGLRWALQLWFGQFCIGMALAVSDTRPLVPAVLHVLMTPALGAALVLALPSATSPPGDR